VGDLTEAQSTQTSTMLATHDLRAAYRNHIALFGVSIRVAPGEIVAVLGHNGAGKTTLLKAIFGLISPAGGRVEFDGADTTGSSYVASVRAGMTFTPAEAAVFRDLTVRDNLELGAFTVSDRAGVTERLEKVLTMFPVLRERHDQLAGTLSGGQQRMLSLGIALMAGPKLMLLDEPGLGIAPALAQSIFERIHAFSRDEGLSVVLVEQNVRAALRIADRAYFLRAGRIILEESGAKALAREKWWDLF
jgi:branched-chain amino acid transport system ATP-binding protein